MQLTESQIQKQCLDLLRHNGYFAWRNHVQSVKMTGARAPNPAKGSSDIFAIKQSLFYAIEVKTPTGKVSSDQYTWLRKASQYGAIAMVVRSVEELQGFLKLVQNNPKSLRAIPFEIIL
jgi:hypothetical protein